MKKLLFLIITCFAVSVSKAQCPSPATGIVNMYTGGATITPTSFSSVGISDAGVAADQGFIIFLNNENVFSSPLQGTATSGPSSVTVNSIYSGSGPQIVSNNNVFVNASNLTPNTTYYIKPLMYRVCSGGGYQFASNFDPDVRTITTANFSSNLATNPVFGSITDNSMELSSFTALTPTAPSTAPTGYIIKINTTNSFTSYPQDTPSASLPTANTIYSGSGEQVVYVGSSTSPNITMTGLTANTEYYFSIIAYYDTAGGNLLPAVRVYQQTGLEFSKSNNSSLVDPNLTFNNITTTAGSAAFNLNATSNSSATISYSIISNGGTNVALSGTNNQTVTVGNVGGTATLLASQASDGTTYNSTTQIMTLTINKLTPVVTHIASPNVNSSLDLNTQVTSTSTGAKSYEIVGPTFGCSITGTTITSTGETGTIILKMSQPETDTHAATEVFLAVGIIPAVLAPIDYGFNLFDTSMNVGDTFQIIDAIEYTNDNITLTYTIVGSNTTGSTLVGNTFTAGSTAGSVTVRAQSTAVTSYFNATTKDVTFTINGAAQNITFPTIATPTCGTPSVNLAATASSGLPVTYTSSNEAIATVSGSTLNILNTGTVNITASQPGGSTHSAAPNVVQSYTIDAANFVRADVIADQTETTFYTLPALTNGEFFTGTGRTGTQLNAGDQLIESQTVYINKQHPTITSCSNESSFTVTITAPPSKATALHFDGASGTHDYISVPDNDLLDLTNSITLEAWVKFDNVTRDNWMTIFSKSLELSGSYGLAYYGSTGNISQFGFWFNGITEFALTHLIEVPINTWTHVAATLSASKATLYINGVLATETNITPGSVATNATPLYIGGIAGATPYPFEGSIDEARVWNVTRTAAQILANKDTELRGDETGMVAYYNMNQGTELINNSSITSLLDKTANANNGTFHQFALNGATSNFVNGTSNGVEKLPSVTPKVFLQGPYDATTNLMNDALRSASLIPTTSPYGDGANINSSVLSVTGNNAIVDWVFVELRDKTDITNVIATVPALLQRDGDVVGLDGVSSVAINVTADNYYVAIGHRNHISIATSATAAISSTVSSQDFTNTASFIEGGTLAVSEVATSIFAMVAGDVNASGSVQTTDINPIVLAIGAVNYNVHDVNMNGAVQTTDTPIARSLIGKIKQF